MFPGGERLQRQLEMEPRRNRDHDRIDRRVVDGRAVIAIAADAPVLLAVRVGLRAVPAGVAAGEERSERLKMAAVDAA